MKRKILTITYTCPEDKVNLGEVDIMGTIHTPSGEMRFKEYRIGLKDSNEAITGSKFAGEGDETIYETRYTFRPAFQFTEAGRYRFEIENLSASYENPGIVSVGVGVVSGGR